MPHYKLGHGYGEDAHGPKEDESNESARFWVDLERDFVGFIFKFTFGGSSSLTLNRYPIMGSLQKETAHFGMQCNSFVPSEWAGSDWEIAP